LNKSSKSQQHSDTADQPLCWNQLSLEIPGQILADVETALNSVGALSISLKDAADQPLLEPAPGNTPLWDSLVVEALFDAGTPVKQLIEQLLQKLPDLNTGQITSKIIENKAWERVWMDRFKPMSFGNRLWIYPHHIQPQDNDTVNVFLDPGLAFGTGTHSTTALCLQWLDAQNLAGKTLLDYGCGSGVLAIAALKLGAKKVYAVDIDEQALLATRENAKLNQVIERIEIFDADELPAIQVDIVLANIISSILISLRKTLTQATRPGGALIMSGLLENQADDIRQVYADDFSIATPQQHEDWCLLECQKRR
jgi:ribosomal protein L11 methyltransferase